MFFWGGGARVASLMQARPALEVLSKDLVRSACCVRSRGLRISLPLRSGQRWEGGFRFPPLDPLDSCIPLKRPGAMPLVPVLGSGGDFFGGSDVGKERSEQASLFPTNGRSCRRERACPFRWLAGEACLSPTVETQPCRGGAMPRPQLLAAFACQAPSLRSG